MLGSSHSLCACKDKTDRPEGSWPGSGIIAVVFSVGSHDLFLALCHRTVPGAANPLFERASPPPASELQTLGRATLLALRC